jgi:type IV pilus assembly protein PilM
LSYNISKKYKGLVGKISTSKFTAIDIGTHSTKVLEIERRGDSISINNISEIETPKKSVKDKTLVDFRGLITTVALNLGRSGKGYRDIKCVISTDQIQNKLVAYPFVGEQSIKSAAIVDFTIHFEDRNQTLYTFDYATLGQYLNNNIMNTSVVLTNMPVTVSHELYEAFKENKLRLTDLDVDIACLSRSLSIFGSMNDVYKTILHMGHNQSMMIFVKNGTVIFSRTFNFSYQHLMKELQDQLDIPAFNCETLIRFVGVDGLDEPDEQEEQTKLIIDESVSKFVIDIDKSFRHMKHQFQFDISEVILSGGFSKLKGLDRYLTQALGTKFVELDVNENWGLNGIHLANHSDKPLGPEFLQALGLAVRGVINETN